jgi:hypothetical protein
VHAVIETPDYLADAKATGLTEPERIAIVSLLAAQPTAGDLIPGTGGARKLRVAGRGKGKSGGYRVVTFFGGTDVPVFLLNVFAKGDRIDLSQAERNALREELSGLVDDWREGVRTRAARR